MAIAQAMTAFITPSKNKFPDPFESASNAVSTAAIPPTTNDNDSLRISDVDINQPLDLASKFVDASLLRDRTSPILDDPTHVSYAVNYNFSPQPNGLGPYSPFERTEIINIPDEILEEYNKVETVGNMGIFSDIKRIWITIDNRLILWNMNKTTEFQTFEDITHTILKVELVKPKANCFTDAINFLLLISTPFDIYILGVAYLKNNEIELYNTGMKVPVHGISVDRFISYKKTGQIFFTGAGDGLNIWELQYSNSEDWFNKKCNKRCLTRSTVSGLIPGSSIIGSIFSYFEGEEGNDEHVSQLIVDDSRGILYILSNKSYIRSYKIKESGDLEGPLVFRPTQISTFAKTSSAKASPLLRNPYLKIVALNVVSRQENEDLFLVAITIGGCRVYLNGFFNTHSVGALRIASVKFPPTKVTKDQIATEQRTFRDNEALKSITNKTTFNKSLLTSSASQMPTLLTYQKKSSTLLESKSSSKILSPGIFFDVVQKPDSKEQRLFVTVPDYGILKYHYRYVENATFLECSGSIHQIVPLSKSFNATDKPQGYANEFATQYISGPYEVAVLTNTSLQIYRYRTPDLIFEALNDDYTSFVSNYGLLEASSTALYVICKYNISKTIRSNAFSFFTLGIPNVVDFKPTYNNVPKVQSLVTKGLSNINKSNSTPSTFSFGDVILSPRFYGIVALLGRLLREIWDSKVFVASKNLKFKKDGTLNEASVFDNEYLESISIDENQIEFFLSSITVLNEFFQTYGNTIACFLVSNFNKNNFDKAEEFANQAENIAVNSIIRLIISIKEALSFLNILNKKGDNSDFDNTSKEDFIDLRDIFKYLSLDVQSSLSNLKFKDVFAPTENTKNLLKEILSSIINRSMSRGESIEYIAKGLQERCGSFCSANDVVGFRAIEHLRKAKEVGFKDYDGLNYHLSRAIELFEAINNEISIEKLKESIKIMAGLNDFPRAIKFALNISTSIDPGNLALQYISDGKLPNDERKVYYQKRKDIFEIVFRLLVQVDKLALDSQIKQEISNSDFELNRTFELDQNGLLINDFVKLRDESYNVAFDFKDEFFHYEFYEWFIEQGVSERLLEIDTPYILKFLKEKSIDSLEISDLLWIYQSKKGDHYSAALVSYSLALSDFNISLSQRNEYLSRAIGFCNCTALPNQRQQVIELSNLIEEVFQASNIQYDLLVSISNDKKISDDKKVELMDQLDGKILTISELFNDFADVLSYHEICLNIYKVSDFRNSDEILSRWFQLFDSIKDSIYTNDAYLNEKNEITQDEINKGEIFIKLLSQTIIKVGKKLCNSEFVFPINELFPIVLNLIYETEGTEDIIKTGGIVDIFIETGVSFDKLYYVLKEVIDTNTNDENLAHYKSEMVYLIKRWYQEDIRLREVVNSDEISGLIEYSSAKDPIHNYISKI